MWIVNEEEAIPHLVPLIHGEASILTQFSLELVFFCPFLNDQRGKLYGEL